MCALCSAVKGRPSEAFDIPAMAFSLACGVIMWAFPRNVAAAAILARAESVFAGFDVRFTDFSWQECPQKNRFRRGFGLPHSIHKELFMESNLSLSVFDVKDVPAELSDCFEPAQCGKCYVCEMVAVFREVRRVLREDGVLFLNLGDSYYHAIPSGPQGKTGDRAIRTFTAAGAGGQRVQAQCTTGGGWSQSLKPKDLVGIPWRVAFALQADGWYLRQDIIWHKPNPMPESVTDRCTKSHEYLFLLTKSARYYYDADAVREPHSDRALRDVGKNLPARTKAAKHHADKNDMHGRYGADTYAETLERNGGVAGHPNGRNRRSVWTIATKPYSGAHFATFPPALILPCIMAGCPAGGTVLDPFGGSGTTGVVASGNGRRAVLVELNPEYAKLAQDRCGLFCSPNNAMRKP